MGLGTSLRDRIRHRVSKACLQSYSSVKKIGQHNLIFSTSWSADYLHNWNSEKKNALKVDNTFNLAVPLLTAHLCISWTKNCLYRERNFCKAVTKCARIFLEPAFPSCHLNKSPPQMVRANANFRNVLVASKHLCLFASFARNIFACSSFHFLRQTSSEQTHADKTHTG